MLPARAVESSAQGPRRRSLSRRFRAARRSSTVRRCREYNSADAPRPHRGRQVKVSVLAATTWSIDILRQSGWDLWLLICAIASVVLVSYALIGRLWRTLSGLAVLLMIGIGAGGTVLIIVTPSLQTPWVGLFWTFVVLCLLSATFYLNLTRHLSPRKLAVLLAMRLLALALLVPMFFEPVLRIVTRPRPDVPLLFLIDVSGSMSVPDVQNGPTRLQSVWQTLRPQIPRIEEHFVPRYFVFSNDVEELKKADELARRPADGKSTDIGGAIPKVIRLSYGLRSEESIIVLISDGIDNVSPDVAAKAQSTGRRIHTVRVGSEQAEPAALANVAVDNVETAGEFVVDHESKVRVTVKSSALANRVVEVKMTPVDADGKPAGKLVSRTLVLQPLPEGQVVELPYTPKTVGVQRLAVWIDPIAGERSTVDNRQEFQDLALDPRIRVLYIEGRLRPEYTQLNRALQRDPNIELATLLRTHQAVFQAAGTVNGEPFSEMPATAEAWKKFDVIILGDLDSSMLSKVQQTAIEQRVFHGGGLLMIGGQNNFGPGGYKDTVIEKALPVFVGDLNSPQERSPFVPKLTPEGLTHPAMEGLAEWFDPGNRDEKRKLPPLRGNVVVNRPKAGASVLLVHAERPGPDGSPQIVLAVQRYGEGRSAAFTADTTYLWYLPLRGMGQDSPYNRFWGQLVRWLAGEDTRHRSRGPGVDGLLNKTMYQLGESVRVRAMVRDERGDATRYAQVNLKLRKAGSAEERQLPLNPVDTRTGLYDVTIPNPDKGDWIVTLSASKDGKPLGSQELKFTVIPPAEEMLKLAANPQLLKDIAARTGGFHYELAQLPNLLDELIRREKRSMQIRQETISLANFVRMAAAWLGSNPPWHTRYDLPMQAMLVFIILVAEWMLRRHWQLP